MGGSGKKKGNKGANSPSIDPQLQRSFDVAVRLKAEREQREALAAKPCSETTSPKDPSDSTSARLKEGLTPWEMKMTEASQASRINAIANEKAINEAVGMLEKSTATCSNVLSTDSMFSNVIPYSEVSSSVEIGLSNNSSTGEAPVEFSKLGVFNVSDDEIELPEEWEDSPDCLHHIQDSRELLRSSFMVTPEAAEITNELSAPIQPLAISRGIDSSVRTGFDLNVEAKNTPSLLRDGAPREPRYSQRLQTAFIAE